LPGGTLRSSMLSAALMRTSCRRVC
jgi:hypothetical protein